VHFPKFIAARPDRHLRWYQSPADVGAYQAACAIATGFRPARMRGNITLVNSDWTGRLVRARHGIETVTLPPPAAGAFPDLPWTDRRFAVACVGRIAPEKRIEDVIGIVTRVREAYPELTLRIIGNADDLGYLKHVEDAVQSRTEWVSLHLDVPRDRLVQLLTQCRFGIHGMHNEHFGMAVAELIRAGAITFAANNGGPVEILGGDRRLLYDNDDDAVEKISRVIRDDALAAELRTFLASRADIYSSARFVHDFRQIVAGLMPPSIGDPAGA
jgi:glycosyltransferase involved in cell wall biosynthesis